LKSFVEDFREDPAAVYVTDRETLEKID